MSLKIKIFEFNPFPVNTYLLYDDETKDAIVIDAGMYTPAEEMELSEFVADNALRLRALLNTHLHFDHCFGMNYMNEVYGLRTIAAKEDEFLLKAYAGQAARFRLKVKGPLPEIGCYVEKNELLEFGTISLKALHVPGHSPGSMVYYSSELNAAFSGDTLFCRSIGRTDLPGGDADLLIGSIKCELFTLPDTTVVYPGHGPSTTIGKEKTENFYIR